MRTVSAREANQTFSKLLAEAENGRDVVITKRGQPVARLTAYEAQPRGKDREAAIKRLMDRLEKGVHLGSYRFKRDELYDR